MTAMPWRSLYGVSSKLTAEQNRRNLGGFGRSTKLPCAQYPSVSAELVIRSNRRPCAWLSYAQFTTSATPPSDPVSCSAGLLRPPSALASTTQSLLYCSASPQLWQMMELESDIPAVGLTAPHPANLPNLFRQQSAQVEVA